MIDIGDYAVSLNYMTEDKTGRVLANVGDILTITSTLFEDNDLYYVKNSRGERWGIKRKQFIHKLNGDLNYENHI